MATTSPPVADSAEPEDSGLGLRHYLDVLWRRKLTLLAAIALCVGVALGISFAQPKKYEATTKIVVGQANGLIPSAFANAVQPYTATMADLVKSNIVASTVIQDLGLANETPESLLAKMSVSINPSTAVMAVSITDRDPNRAVAIAKETATVFSRLVKERFGSKPVELSPGTTQLPLTATVFDPAHANPAPVSPKPVRNTAIALVLGLVLGLLAAFLREHFDRALRTREAVEQAFGVPVIGQIPFGRTRKGDERPVSWEGSGEIAEAFSALRANLQYLGVQRPLRSILVTSAAPEQGKTTVTANLAVAIARSGESTVVIEGDLRRPRLSHAFGVGPSTGLTNALVTGVDPASILVDVPIASDEGGAVSPGRLSFLNSGPLPPNPSELLSSPQMGTLVERLGLVYDRVLIDSPPFLLVADGLELAGMVDGVLLVVRRDRASRDEAHEIRALARRLDIRLVGTVFAGASASGTSAYSAYGEPEQRREAPRRRGAKNAQPVVPEDF